jgi:predicted nucleic acid-binding protein
MASHRAQMLLYLDQNYLSGIVKRKPAFRELEPVLRDAVASGAVRVAESEVHRVESAARPDLGLLDLLRDLSGGTRLPDDEDPTARRCARSLRILLERDYPDRAPLGSDDLDIAAMSRALPHCDLVTCDAFMAELIRRARLDTWCGCELFTGRRQDVERLRRRLQALSAEAGID